MPFIMPFSVISVSRRRAYAKEQEKRAAERGDELAPSQFIELHSVIYQQGSMAGYQISNGQSAGMPHTHSATGLRAACKMPGPVGVKPGKSRNEQLFSDLPPEADLTADIVDVSQVPLAVMPPSARWRH